MLASSPPHVCVLGAGIVGLATAWQLQRQGYKVTVIDRAQAGSGTSGANGAQLSYAYVQPLAGPEIWCQLPRLLLAADSPLKLRLQADPHQWAWGLRFLAACRSSVSQRTTASLLALAAESRASFEQLMVEEHLDCDFSATGKLVLYPDETSFASARRQLALQSELGSVQHALTPAESVAVEPALAAYASRFVGAIHTPSECAADCHKVCLALQGLLQARGARFLLDTPVTQLLRRGERIVAAQTLRGEIEAEAYVVALGTASHPLARMLGLQVPVYPLKGYSITVDIDESAAAAPSVNVTDAARKVVFARIGTRLRVAGMAELTGYDLRIPGERISSLVRSSRALFPQASRYEELRPWSGLRPATPTGLPVLGRLHEGPTNLLFNTGHGSLGFTLAFGSAQRIAAQLAGLPVPAVSRSAPEPAAYNA